MELEFLVSSALKVSMYEILPTVTPPQPDQSPPPTPSGVGSVEDREKIMKEHVVQFLVELCGTEEDTDENIIRLILMKIQFDLLSAGFHLEGPFISAEKKGAHPERFLRTFQSAGIADLMEAYSSLDNVAMVTLAPELAGSQSVVRELSQRGITVSLGERRPDQTFSPLGGLLIRLLDSVPFL